jgi:hypothetical protein
MTELLKFRSGEDTEILVEVADASSGPVMRGRRTDGQVIEAAESFESVLGRIGPALKGIAAELREGTDWPDQIEIEFAVKISADSSVIIARAGGEANFRIALRWTAKAGG